jgi:hypothetical protein
LNVGGDDGDERSILSRESCTYLEMTKRKPAENGSQSLEIKSRNGKKRYCFVHIKFPICFSAKVLFIWFFPLP